MQQLPSQVHTPAGGTSLSDQERRVVRPFKTKSPVEFDVERTITELLSGQEHSEPVKVGKKIIKTPDSETTVEYELAVDPRTGQQQVVEHISTTKQECGRCGKFTSQRQACSQCETKVCGECITTFYYGFGSSPYGTHKVCKSCFEGLSKSWRGGTD
jgi:hypothetical protein